eukprot:Clim_evm1s29 gene=Clim_evmTU1s29
MKFLVTILLFVTASVKADLVFNEATITGSGANRFWVEAGKSCEFNESPFETFCSPCYFKVNGQAVSGTDSFNNPNDWLARAYSLWESKSTVSPTLGKITNTDDVGPVQIFEDKKGQWIVKLSGEGVGGSYKFTFAQDEERYSRQFCDFFGQVVGTGCEGTKGPANPFMLWNPKKDKIWCRQQHLNVEMDQLRYFQNYDGTFGIEVLTHPTSGKDVVTACAEFHG